MDQEQWLAKSRRAEESAREAHLVRARAFEMIAQGHAMLAGATDPAELPSRQTCLKIFDGRKLIAEGYKQLAHSERILSEVSKERAEIINSALEALVAAGGPG